MAGEDIDYTKGLVRNVAIGFVLTFAGSTALCFVALREVGTSLAIAAVPAIFAGPYVGILITLNVAIIRHEKAEKKRLGGPSSAPGGTPVGAVATPNAAA